MKTYLIASAIAVVGLSSLSLWTFAAAPAPVPQIMTGLVDDAQSASGCLHREAVPAAPSQLEVELTIPSGGFRLSDVNKVISIGRGGLRQELFAGYDEQGAATIQYSTNADGDIVSTVVLVPAGSATIACPGQAPNLAPANLRQCGIARFRTTFLSQIVRLINPDATDPTLWHTAVLVDDYQLPGSPHPGTPPTNWPAYLDGQPTRFHLSSPASATATDQYGVYLNPDALVPSAPSSAVCNSNLLSLNWGTDNSQSIQDFLNQAQGKGPNSPAVVVVPPGKYFVLAHETPDGSGNPATGNAAIIMPSYTELRGSTDAVSGQPQSTLLFGGVLGVSLFLSRGWDQEHQGNKAMILVPPGSNNVTIDNLIFQGENNGPFGIPYLNQSPAVILSETSTQTLLSNNTFIDLFGFGIHSPAGSQLASATGNQFIRTPKGLNLISDYSNQNDNFFYKAGTIEAFGAYSNFNNNILVEGAGLWIGGTGYGLTSGYAPKAEYPEMRVMGNHIYNTNPAYTGIYVNSGVVDTLFSGNVVDSSNGANGSAIAGVGGAEGVESTLYNVFMMNHFLDTDWGFYAASRDGTNYQQPMFEPLVIDNLFQLRGSSSESPDILSVNLANGTFVGNQFTAGSGAELAPPFASGNLYSAMKPEIFPGMYLDEATSPAIPAPLTPSGVVEFHCNQFAKGMAVPVADSSSVPKIISDQASCVYADQPWTMTANVSFPAVAPGTFQVLTVDSLSDGSFDLSDIGIFLRPGDLVEANFANGSSFHFQGGGLASPYLPSGTALGGPQDVHVPLFGNVLQAGQIRLVLLNHSSQILEAGSARIQIKVDRAYHDYFTLIAQLLKWYGITVPTTAIGLENSVKGASSTDPVVLKAAILSSQAYWSKNAVSAQSGSDPRSAYITALYRDALHQPVGATNWQGSGLPWSTYYAPWIAYWATQMPEGKAPSLSVLTQFMRSQRAFYNWVPPAQGATPAAAQAAIAQAVQSAVSNAAITQLGMHVYTGSP